MSLLRGKIVVGLLIDFLSLSMMFNADARRFCGSRRSCKQSYNVTERQQAPVQPAPTQQPPAQRPAQQAAPAGAAAGAGAAAAAPRRNWSGMLGGIAAGLGIGWLLSHVGLGGAAMGFLSNLILIALVAFVAIWLIRKLRGGGARREPAYAGQPGGLGGLGGMERG